VRNTGRGVVKKAEQPIKEGSQATIDCRPSGKGGGSQEISTKVPPWKERAKGKDGSSGSIVVLFVKGARRRTGSREVILDLAGKRAVFLWRGPRVEGKSAYWST